MNIPPAAAVLPTDTAANWLIKSRSSAHHEQKLYTADLDNKRIRDQSMGFLLLGTKVESALILQQRMIIQQGSVGNQ